MNIVGLLSLNTNMHRFRSIKLKLTIKWIIFEIKIILHLQDYHVVQGPICWFLEIVWQM